jgi:hypothetical protein
VNLIKSSILQAEVIVTFCGAFAALTLAGYSKVTGTEVPVIENVAVGIKMAELLPDMRKTLGISTSKCLTYQSLLPAEMIEDIAKPFFGSESTQAVVQPAAHSQVDKGPDLFKNDN